MFGNMHSLRKRKQRAENCSSWLLFRAWILPGGFGTVLQKQHSVHGMGKRACLGFFFFGLVCDTRTKGTRACWILTPWVFEKPGRRGTS